MKYLEFFLETMKYSFKIAREKTSFVNKESSQLWITE